MCCLKCLYFYLWSGAGSAVPLVINHISSAPTLTTILYTIHPDLVTRRTWQLPSSHVSRVPVCDVWHLQAGPGEAPPSPAPALVGAVRSQSAAALPAPHTNHALHCWRINLSTKFREVFTIFAGSAHQRLTLWASVPRLNHVPTPVCLY